MASNFLSALSLISCLLSFIFFSQICYVNSVPLHSGTSDKVPVAIYYQSLGNADFFTEVLPVISKKGLFSIIDLHLCPWGNSKTLTKEPFTFICQGGELECKINTIEACAIYTWPDVDKHFSFIKCVESLVPLIKGSGESLIANNKTAKWESKSTEPPAPTIKGSGTSLVANNKTAKWESKSTEPPAPTIKGSGTSLVANNKTAKWESESTEPPAPTIKGSGTSLVANNKTAKWESESTGPPAPTIKGSGTSLVANNKTAKWESDSTVPPAPPIKGSGKSLVADNKAAKWESCYSILKYDRKPIDECYNSGLGKKLERKYAEETAALIPPKEFTPWILVAGEPIKEDVMNLPEYVCKAYKGSSPPEACREQ